MLRLKFLLLTVAKSKALSAVWTFPSILFSAILIAWGAESAQFLVSQGLILAIISWLQTAPEFVVEGLIAWDHPVGAEAERGQPGLQLLARVEAHDARAGAADIGLDH